MSGRAWTENLSGGSLCIPQILSPLCVLVSMLRKGGCNDPLQVPAGTHHLLVWLHLQLLPLILGGLNQNVDYLAMDARTSEMALYGMRWGLAGAKES